MFKRRSARVQLRIPLTIEIGDETVLEAETVTVSKHGAKVRIMGFRSNQAVRSHGKLSCGDPMLVVNRAVRKSGKARIVWQDKRAEPHYGIELDEPGNFWGVYFPTKDGEDWRAERKAPQPVTEAVFTPTAPTEVVTLPVLEPIDSEGPAIPALVTGITAARMPLAERVDVVFTRPDEASALLHHLVEPGASVRLILPDDRIMMGRVATVGGQRQAGKWRVRIKCEVQA
ncbi:MAG: PilZ domain-containing protein [Terriglobales bacterium]